MSGSGTYVWDTVLQMQHVVDRVELAELGGCVQVHIGNGMFKWV